MKKNHFNYLIIILVTGAMLGLGSYAMAGPGAGYKSCGRGADRADLSGNDFGPGRCRQGRPDDSMSNLSDEERKKLDEERAAYHEATKDLKREIQRKRLELRAELVGKTTDVKKARALQKELSDLKSDLDLKRLEHWLKIKEILPDADLPHFAFSHKGRGHRWQGAQLRCW